MTNPQKRELAALKRSALANLAMAAAGFLFAALTGSEALLLDGVFSLLGFIMLLFARRVAVLVNQPDTERFHFGFARFEPLMNSVRGLLTLVTIVFASGSAVVAIVAGGRELSAGLALVYAILIAGGCFVLAIVQRRAARATRSPILETDADNWLVDGAITSGIGLVFVGALLIKGTDFAFALPYVDPVVVLLLSVTLAWVPYRIVRDNVAQLLDEAPPTETQDEVHRRLDAALGQVPLQARRVRMLEVGRTAYVLATLVVKNGDRATSVAGLDQVRERVATALEGLHPHVYLDVVFTADERWIDGRI